MDFEKLSEEQKAKARACESAQELMELAEKEGIELTDAELDAFAGGVDWFDCDDLECPSNCPRVTLGHS